MGALAKAFRGWTLGLAACQYQQLAGDSGGATVLGGCKRRATGLGPTVGRKGAWSRQPLVFGGSSFYEVGVGNRVPGDVLFLNPTLPLGAGTNQG